MSQIKIDLGVIEKLFPFFFVTDNRGVLLHAGPSLTKLGSNWEGSSFSDLFHVERPAQGSFSTLSSGPLNEMVIFRLKTCDAKFMGQVMDLEGGKFKIFITNLVVQDADELTALKLDFNDFAIQDPIFDYLMLLQTQKRAIRQADESNKKLELAHAVAVKASETKSQFLANMSHELRTPMNGLLGMAEILKGTPLNDEQKDYLNTVISSGEAMLALINDILDLSKIEAGHIQLDCAEVQLSNMLKDIEQTVYPTVTKKGLDFRLLIAPDVPARIFTDPVRLRQVILNLVGNAVKFTLRGTVSVEVKLLSTQENQANIQFTVCDTGVGMSPDTLKKIFAPFVQGDSSMTKKFEGTGLGLSISKKLVQAMGGTISVQSKENIGSTFSFNVLAQARTCLF